LVDGGQFFLERFVEQFEDLGIALHLRLLAGEAAVRLPSKQRKRKIGGKPGKTCD
jgi:hypothetical protein